MIDRWLPARLGLVVLAGCPKPSSAPEAPQHAVATPAAAPGTAPAAPSTPPPLPPGWRSPEDVVYSCPARGFAECTEWLAAHPRVGTPDVEACRPEDQTPGPCPTASIVGICDHAEYSGTLDYFYEPMSPDKARELCHGRFWPKLPTPGSTASSEDRVPRATFPEGCAEQAPQPLAQAHICLDLPDGTAPLSRLGPRYDPDRVAGSDLVAIEHFRAGSYQQVFVYRQTPMVLHPTCDEAITERQLRRREDAYFVLYEGSVPVQGEHLRLRCIGSRELEDRTRSICQTARLRWCDADER